jgi:hypothetical protein
MSIHLLSSMHTQGILKSTPDCFRLQAIDFSTCSHASDFQSSTVADSLTAICSTKQVCDSLLKACSIFSDMGHVLALKQS